MHGYSYWKTSTRGLFGGEINRNTDTKYLHIGDHKFLDYNGSMEVFDDEEQLLHIV